MGHVAYLHHSIRHAVGRLPEIDREVEARRDVPIAGAIVGSHQQPLRPAEGKVLQGVHHQLARKVLQSIPARPFESKRPISHILIRNVGLAPTDSEFAIIAKAEVKGVKHGWEVGGCSLNNLGYIVVLSVAKSSLILLIRGNHLLLCDWGG